MSDIEEPDPGDPFGPPAVPTMVACLHCKEEYDSYRIEWRVERGSSGQPRGFWCCPIPGCDGKGFGFDILPTDPNYRDERGGWFTDDSEDEDEYDDDGIEPGIAHAHLRIARPTDNLEAVVAFYRDGLGFEILSEFNDHDGFDGVMLGRAGAAYHLEFTRKAGHAVGRAPTEDNLLVFYLPDEVEWQSAVERMESAGHKPVKAFNPYWDRRGRTYEDPDGYRIVLKHANWPERR